MDYLELFAFLYLELIVCFFFMFMSVMVLAGRHRAEGWASIAGAALSLAVLWPMSMFDIISLMTRKK